MTSPEGLGRRPWDALMAWFSDEDRREWLAGLTLLTLLLVSFVSRSGFPWDRGDWVSWAQHIQKHGLAHAYDSGANYHPLWLYVLDLYARLCPTPQAVDAYIPFLKLAALSFDVLIVLAVSGLLAGAGVARRRSLWLLANPAFVYISLLWGQVDSVFTAFLVLALWAAVRGAPVSGSVCLTLALLAKLQAVILVPPLAVLLLWPARRQPRRIAAAAVASLGTALAVLAPFILAGTFGQVVEVFRSAIGFHPVVSKGAYGFWTLLLPGEDLGALEDSGGVLGMPYKSLGLGLCGLHYLLALGAMLRAWRGESLAGAQGQRLARLCSALALMVMAFFLFATQMHERYLYPAVPLMGLAAALTGRWGAYLGLSAGFLLNLEHVLGATLFARLVRALPPWSIAVVLMGVFWGGLFRLWTGGHPSAGRWERLGERTARWLCRASVVAVLLATLVGMTLARRAGFHLTFVKPQLLEGYVKLTELPILAQEGAPDALRANEGWAGGALRTGHVDFGFGFGTHAPSTVSFRVPPTATVLQTVVGLADSASTCQAADVLFRVADSRGRVLAETGILGPGSRPVILRVHMRGVTEVTLQTLEGRNGRDCDHAVWGEPVFFVEQGR